MQYGRRLLAMHIIEPEVRCLSKLLPCPADGPGPELRRMHVRKGGGRPRDSPGRLGDFNMTANYMETVVSLTTSEKLEHCPSQYALILLIHDIKPIVQV